MARRRAAFLEASLCSSRTRRMTMTKTPSPVDAPSLEAASIADLPSERVATMNAESHEKKDEPQEEKAALKRHDAKDEPNTESIASATRPREENNEDDKEAGE